MPRTKTTRPPGNGAGWGGPAKGAGSGPAKPFDADTPTRVTMTVAEARAMNGDQPSKYATRKALEEARAAELRDHLYTLATSAEREETQLSATVAFLNRVEGMPTQKQQVSGPDDGPVQTSLTVSFVKPSGVS